MARLASGMGKAGWRSSMAQKQYLDDSGNPITAPGKVYLDDDGNPVGKGPAPRATATMQAAQPQDWLTQADEDLRQGGTRTVVGRWLGNMQGRGEKGYSGMESGTTPAVADYMGSVPLGAIKTAQGIKETPEHPVRGPLKAAGGVLQMAEIPLSFMGGPAVDAATPSTVRAGHLFASIAEDAGNVPVALEHSGEPIRRFNELASRGGQQTKVVEDLMKRLRTISKGQGPITYSEARDFYSNMSRLSSEEITNLNPIMRKQMTEVARAFSKDVADAAAQVGRAGDYWKAMGQYARASRLADAQKILMKKAIQIIGIGTGLAVGEKLYHAMAPRAGNPTDEYAGTHP